MACLMAAMASPGQNAADGEKACLHDGVDAAAHARFPRHAVSIDQIEFELLVDDGLLDLARQMAPNFFLTKGGVQQEGCAWLGRREHVDAIDERELVASDEAGLGGEIGGRDLFRAETDVRNGDSAG